MTTHSDKACKTLGLMGLNGITDTKHADIEWTKAKRMVKGLVPCSVCQGLKATVKNADGSLKPAPKGGWKDHAAAKAYLAEAAAQTERGNGMSRGTCQACKCSNSRARMYGWCTGTEVGMVEREVWVGKVLWPAGTLFDSRFSAGKTDRHCCELCSKTLQSWQVPVVGTDAAGVIHGFWTGTDCAKKFLGVQTKVKAPDGSTDQEAMVLEGPA